jgi:hypothetical protein
MACAAERWSWITSLVNTGLTYASLLQPISDHGKSFGSQTMFATVQTGLQRAAELLYWSAGV